MHRVPKMIACVSACLCVCQCMNFAGAQSLSDRISAVKEQRQQEAARQAEQAQPPSQEIPTKMRKIIDEVVFDQTPAHEVFAWWSRVTDIPIVIDYVGMEVDGVDHEQTITMTLQTVPARVLLDVIMRQASPDVELIYEATPWYVQVMTKRQANRNPVLRVYDIADMTMTIPNFTNAPDFDLGEALGGSGGGGSGGGSDLFTTNDVDDSDEQPTKAERGEDLADLIRQTIEPEIWQAHGGLYASARYYDGKLIVNAPGYVHRQIGIPQMAAYQPGSSGGYRSEAGGTAEPGVSKPFGVQER